MNSSASHSVYIHGSTQIEQRRLSTLNEMINEDGLRELYIKGGERLIDFGSGLGQFTRAAARRAGGSRRAVGIERDPQQLAEALRQAAADGESHLVDFRQGEATHPPLRDEEWGTFDLAISRFLLEHVPDPPAVVRAMVKAVRPGGRIILADDDHDVLRLWPDLPSFTQLWSAYIKSYVRFGNDPYIGRKLTSLLSDAGAKPTRNHWQFFGSCAGHPMWNLYIENIIGFLSGAREAIIAAGKLTEDWFDQAIAEFRNWSRRPEASLWYSICWAEGVRQT